MIYSTIIHAAVPGPDLGRETQAILGLLHFAAERGVRELTPVEAAFLERMERTLREYDGARVGWPEP